MSKRSLLIICLLVFASGWITAQTAPVAVIVSTKTVDIKGITYFVHTVEKGQTLYSITRAYQVTAAQIIRGSDKPDLQLGEIIKIPKIKPVDIINATIATPTTSLISPKTKPVTTIDSTLSPALTQAVPMTHAAYKRKVHKDTLHIACLIPMYLNEAETFVPTFQNLQQRLQGLPKNISFLSLYEGVLMALDSLPCPTIHFVLHTFDITDDYRTADSLVRSGKLASMDLIIGPLFLKGFKAVSSYAKTQHIPIINPLSDKSDYLVNNPYAFMLNVSKEKRIEHLCNYIIEENAHRDVIIVGHPEHDAKGIAEAQQLLAKGGVKKIRTIDITKGRVNRLDSLLRPTVAASVLFIGDGEVELTQAIQLIARLNKPYLSTFFTEQFGFFEKIDSEYLNKVRAHFVQPVYSDYQDSLCINFERTYFAKYATLPDRNAYIGYDLMRYVLELMCLNNRNIFDNIEQLDFKGMATPIRFSRKPQGGYENTSSRILKMEYSNLIIVH